MVFSLTLAAILMLWAVLFFQQSLPPSAEVKARKATRTSTQKWFLSASDWLFTCALVIASGAFLWWGYTKSFAGACS